ncbi:hypothetical protein DSM106972_055920 [Dulcicalothrix desertica PCC 7102]|uniref:Uncharacterized protein n=1 Tax=Dulcicalothrix desertica PCC 7102 TaxID=232991 RepID=A0A433VB00_9CYAN|nr:general stress protein [Dulcicalothrix desertica]RUT03284.1 hypothetical protein DSM106972_055920 [Dulcicalothrix desertica PCC 7102]TWH53649.1 heat induced stress protein YflT [Dulcicalothrix desertica PCC 7102]
MANQDVIHAIGVFASTDKVEQAVNALKASDFPMEKVSVIAKDVEKGESIGEAPLSDQIGEQNVNTTGVVGDTLAGATWGSVLVGLSSLALPGLGAILAAGSVGVALVASIGGVAVGAAATQNLVKALADLGVPEDRARVYSDRLQQSNYMLIVDGTKEDINRAEPILRDQNIEYWGIYNSLQTQNV